ncbi:MAG: ABC transporter ATP-binding protein [Burkholderiales bacterium]|nr:ABC transporter ATP-binding protein [Burkholderiales bacterium]
MLQVESLGVRYGSIPAVRDITFYVDAGEAVCFVGPNGAGKSTTVLTVAGLLAPHTGHIRFDGRAIDGTSAEDIAQLGVSLVPEGRRIFSRLTVGENLKLAKSLRPGSAAATRLLDRVLELFPILRERYDGYAGLLSGGEQQQLAIARALLTQPRLLIVDEPSLGLAPKYVDLVFAAFAHLRAENMTLLIVEQSIRRALAFADRVYLLRSGAIVRHGRAADLRGDADFESAYFGGAATP